jgi:hypothetical protein
MGFLRTHNVKEHNKTGKIIFFSAMLILLATLRRFIVSSASLISLVEA